MLPAVAADLEPRTVRCPEPTFTRRRARRAPVVDVQEAPPRVTLPYWQIAPALPHGGAGFAPCDVEAATALPWLS